MQKGEDVIEYAFLRDIRMNEFPHLWRIAEIKKAHPLGCAFFIKIHFLTTSLVLLLVLPSSVQPLVQPLVRLP